MKIDEKSMKHAANLRKILGEPMNLIPLRPPAQISASSFAVVAPIIDLAAWKDGNEVPPPMLAISAHHYRLIEL